MINTKQRVVKWNKKDEAESKKMGKKKKKKYTTRIRKGKRMTQGNGKDR